MSSDQPYVPSEARVCIDYCNAVVARRKPADEADGLAEADEEFDRFLARVRRDAAREALDGLADHIDLIASQIVGVRVGSQKAKDVRAYRDTHYPEEAP